MHFFPRARRHRMYAASVAGVLAIGLAPLLSASATTDDELADRRDDVKSSIASASEELEGSSTQARDALVRLRAAKDQLVDARTRLDEARAKLAAAQRRDTLMKARLKAAEERLATAQAELEAGRAAVQRQREAVAATISSIYTEGNPQLLVLSSLMHARTAEDLIRQIGARDAIVDTQTQSYEALALAEEALAAKEAEVEAATVEVAARRKEAAKQLNLMEDLEADAESAANDVASLVEARTTARVAAWEAMKADREKLRQLRAEEERIKRVLARRAAAARAAAAAAAGVPVDSGGFLAYPVNGRVSSPFGYRRHPIYGYWGLHDGVDFATGCGTPMYAAASGTVIASIWSSVYGNRLIIDHGLARGVGLATIYNHATSYVVGRGSTVKRGQLVGYVGSTGWSTGCHLHFTVMANGKAVDPMGWF